MAVATPGTLLDLAVPLHCVRSFCRAVSMTSSHKEDLVRCVWTGMLCSVACATQVFGHISPKGSDSNLLNPVSTCVQPCWLLQLLSSMMAGLLPSHPLFFLPQLSSCELWIQKRGSVRDCPARATVSWSCAICKDKSCAAQASEREVLWKAGLS